MTLGWPGLLVLSPTASAKEKLKELLSYHHIASKKSSDGESGSGKADDASADRKERVPCCAVKVVFGILVSLCLLLAAIFVLPFVDFGFRAEDGAKVIGVIINDPPTADQMEMLVATKTALDFATREHSLTNPMKLKIISVRDKNQTPEDNRKMAEDVRVFVDLRKDMPAISEDGIRKTEESSASKDSPLVIVTPFPLSAEENKRSGSSEIEILSTSGSVRGLLAAISTKMSEVDGNQPLLPLVSEKSRHQRALKTFRDVASSLVPGAKILDPVTFPPPGRQEHSSPKSRRDPVELTAETVIKEAREAIRLSPKAGVILFCDGEEAAALLGILSREKLEIGRRGKLGKNATDFPDEPSLTGRIWYYPEACFWLDELASRKDDEDAAWRIAKAINLYSAGYLGMNQTGILRRKMMVELNANLGKGASFQAVGAFDATLVAINKMSVAHDGVVVAKIPNGITGQLSRFDAVSREGGRLANRDGEYARLMLAPETPDGFFIDVLQETPWLIDGVVEVAQHGTERSRGPTTIHDEHVREGDDHARISVKMRHGASSGHFLSKSYLLQPFFDRSHANGCSSPTVSITAFDPLTFSKVERRYTTAGSLPEFLILADDSGYAVRMSCGSIRGSSLDGDEPREGGSGGDVLIHLVCPAKDPHLRLPCLHSVSLPTASRRRRDASSSIEEISTGGEAVRQDRQHSEPAEGANGARGYGEDGGVQYREIPPEYMQRCHGTSKAACFTSHRRTSEELSPSSSLPTWAQSEPHRLSESAPRSRETRPNMAPRRHQDQSDQSRPPTDSSESVPTVSEQESSSSSSQRQQPTSGLRQPGSPFRAGAPSTTEKSRRHSSTTSPPSSEETPTTRKTQTEAEEKESSGGTQQLWRSSSPVNTQQAEGLISSTGSEERIQPAYREKNSFHPQEQPTTLEESDRGTPATGSDVQSVATHLSRARSVSADIPEAFDIFNLRGPRGFFRRQSRRPQRPSNRGSAASRQGAAAAAAPADASEEPDGVTGMLKQAQTFVTSQQGHMSDVLTIINGAQTFLRVASAIQSTIFDIVG